MFWDIFSSAKTVEKAVDLVSDSAKGIGGWIDRFQFTEQEVAESGMKLLEFKLKVLEKTADESSVRSISRRILAWAITGTFLILVLIAAIGSIIGAGWVNSIMGLAELMYSSFLAVISFYFVSQIGNNWIDKAKGK